MMILNAENSNISLWAYQLEYVKKTRSGTRSGTLRYSFMLSEAPGPLRYKFYAPVQFFTHFLVMISNAKNMGHNSLGISTQLCKKNTLRYRSGTELG